MAKVCSRNLLPIVLLISLVSGQTNVSTPTDTTASTAKPTSTIPENSYDYIIKLVLGLQSEKVPEYVVNYIYESPQNVSILDLIALYKIENLTLSQTQDILKELNYDPNIIFSGVTLKKVLEEVGLSFNNFYNSVFLIKLNVTGLQIRHFLGNLSIDAGAFSLAMTYGDEDPLDVFIKGNFSQANIMKSVEALGKTIEEVFDVSREDIFHAVSLKPTNDILAILNKYNFSKQKALQLWRFLKIDVEDADNVPTFAALLDALRYTLDSTTYLGVLTNHTVGINHAVYESIIEKMKISRLFAKSLNDNTTVQIRLGKPYYEAVLTFDLENDSFKTFAQVATATGNLQNCVFVTLENDTKRIENVDEVVNMSSYLEVDLNDMNITNLIQGSPLICNNKVYGLADTIENGKIIFDPFRARSSAISGFSKLFNPCILFVGILVYITV